MRLLVRPAAPVSQLPGHVRGTGFKIYYQLIVIAKFQGDQILVDSVVEHHAIGNGDDCTKR